MFSSPLDRIRSYHELSKHHSGAYASGPEQPDWESQPLPFRQYLGTLPIFLPLPALKFERPWSGLSGPAAPASFQLESLGALLQLSFAVSVWKRSGRQRWSLRCNPSSGNLHPTEVYLTVSGMSGVADGLHHYCPLNHSLELRAALPPGPRAAGLHLAFSSLLWREAWKYGERGFRYCQLDLGHAAGALAYAAAVMGWRARRVEISGERLGRWLGLDRSGDFPQGDGALLEREEPEMLFQVDCTGSSFAGGGEVRAEWERDLADAIWNGRAGAINSEPGRVWPAAHEVAAVSAFPEPPPQRLPAAPEKEWPPLAASSGAGAVRTILQRRSAQRFDSSLSRLSRPVFYRLLDALLPRPILPWTAMPGTPRIHPAILVLRIEGLRSGLYFLPRRPGAPDFFGGSAEERVSARDPLCPAHLDLRFLRSIEAVDLRMMARHVSCRQDIAADGAFSLAMLGEFDAALEEEGVGGYRRLFQEAGLLGHALYLEAEAAGLRGTGIGCYFDDEARELFGCGGGLQSMYHFSVGVPVADDRIESGPAYLPR